MDTFSSDVLLCIFLRVHPNDIAKCTLLGRRYRDRLFSNDFKRLYFQRWRRVYQRDVEFDISNSTCSTAIVMSIQNAAINGDLASYRFLTSIMGMWFDPNYHRTMVFAEFRVLKFLLTDPKIDLHNGEDDVFQNAVKRGDLNIVKLLLKDGRIDPGWNFNCAIQTAVIFEYPDVVEVLLNDSRIDPRFTKLYNGELVRDELIRRTKNPNICKLLKQWYEKRLPCYE